MNKVYIISRYRAETEEELEFNKKVARYFCREVIEEGNIPIAPHLFYTQFLDDSDLADRKAGLELGLAELRESKEVLLVVIDGVISEGMKCEIAEMGRLGISGRIVALTRSEAEEFVQWKVIK